MNQNRIIIANICKLNFYIIEEKLLLRVAIKWIVIQNQISLSVLS